MLGQMADSGHTDDLTATSCAPPDNNENARPLGSEGSDFIASDRETAAVSVKRPSSVALLADLERRVRKLEARVDGLSSPARSSRRRVGVSDLVRWGLWLMVIGFLTFLWLRMTGPIRLGVPQ